MAALRGAELSVEPPADTIEMVGRDAELATLEAALARSRTRTQLVLIEGPPGIGKSMVARAFCRAAAARDALVFDGRCHEAEDVPFKGLDAAIDSLCNRLVHGDRGYAEQALPSHAGALCLMFPVLRRLDLFSDERSGRELARSPHEVRRQAIDALGELLSRVAVSAPMIIFLDDLQWAGEDTFNLIVAMLATRSPAVLLLATIRSRATQTSGALDAFLTSVAALDTVSVEAMELRALDRAAVAAVVEQNPRPGLTVDTAWNASGGHPYLLVRLLDRHVLANHSGDLSEHLRDSLHQLSPEARRLIEVVALSAMPLPQSAGCHAAGLGGWQPTVVDELRNHGLIRTGVHAESLMGAYHDRVRETVVADLSPKRYRDAHAELAEFLEGSRDPAPHVLATHYLESGQFARARAWSLRAARDAAKSLAFARAATHYATAVKISERNEESLSLYLEWADAMADAGHRAESGRICLEGASLARDRDLLDWSARLSAAGGEHFLISGHFSRGIVLIQQALAEVGVVLPSDPLVAVAHSINIGARLAVRGLEFQPRGEDEIAPQLLRQIDLLLTTSQALSQNDVRSTLASSQALELALEAGHPLRVAQTLFFFVISNGQRDPRHPFFVTAIERNDALAEQVGGVQDRGRAALLRGTMAIFAGSIREAVAELEDAQRQFWNAVPPLATDGGMCRVALMVAYGLCGANLRKAVDRVDSWIAEVAAREAITAMNWLQSMSTWVLLARDAPTEAATRLQQAQVFAGDGNDVFAAMAILNRTAIWIYEDPVASWSWIEPTAREAFERIIASMVPLISGMFALFRANAAAAAWQASVLATAVARDAITASVDSLRAHAVLTAGIPGLEAQLALTRGDRQEAARLFREAARAWDAVGMAAHARSCALRGAQAQGDRDEEVRQDRAMRELAIENPDRFATIFAGPAASVRDVVH